LGGAGRLSAATFRYYLRIKMRSIGMDEKNEPWRHRFLWMVFGAVLAVVGALIVGSVERKSPSLFYCVDPPMVAPFGEEKYVLGRVEMGNDGDVPIDKWEASIAFPKETQIVAISCSLGEIQEKTPASMAQSVRNIKATTVAHVLNPGDRAIVHYLLASEASPTVTLKGLGATAVEREPALPREGAYVSILVYGGLALAALAFAISLFSLCHIFKTVRLMQEYRGLWREFREHWDLVTEQRPKS